MNRDEIKNILLVYRPGTADAEDPEIAEALALAKNDPELSQWLEEHSARQNALRAKFRQIAVPAGLKEQIISEQAARARAASRREKIVGALAGAVIVVSLIVIGVFYLPHNHEPRPIANNLANYQKVMAKTAVDGYYMNLLANNPAEIQSYLSKHDAPANYVLPAGLQKTVLVGCAIMDWKGSKISMICFHTGNPPPDNKTSDLWLFVVDGSAVKEDSTVTTTQLAKVDGLMTATWMQDGKLYMLGMQGDEQTIHKYL